MGQKPNVHALLKEIFMRYANDLRAQYPKQTIRNAAVFEQRRDWAMRALVEYANATGKDRLNNPEDFQDCIADLIGDLGHVAQKCGRGEGCTALHIYGRGIGMFSAENLNPDSYENDTVEIAIAEGRTQ